MWRGDFIDEFTSNLHDAEMVQRLIRELNRKCTGDSDNASDDDQDDDDDDELDKGELNIC